MSAADIAEIIAGVAVAIAVAAVVLVYFMFRRVNALQADQRAILGPKGAPTDIIAYSGQLSSRIERLREALETLSLEVRDHEVRIDGCVSRVGMVRFDAYNDTGGRQSTAVGLLTAKDDGLVLTTVVSRDFARIYVKIIKDGEADIPLAPEEQEALDQARARGSAPFTIRPRPAPADRSALEEAAAVPLIGEVEEEKVALERENRHRRRQGLPPLESLPDRDDLGWPQLQPLEPLELLEPIEPVEPLEARTGLDFESGNPRARNGRREQGRNLLEEPDPFDDL